MISWSNFYCWTWFWNNTPCIRSDSWLRLSDYLFSKQFTDICFVVNIVDMNMLSEWVNSITNLGQLFLRKNYHLLYQQHLLHNVRDILCAVVSTFRFQNWFITKNYIYTQCGVRGLKYVFKTLSSCQKLKRKDEDGQKEVFIFR